MTIKEKIQEVSNTHYNGSYRFFKRGNLLKYLGKSYFDELFKSVDVTLHEPCSLAVYCYMNDIYTPPKCKCGNTLKFNTTKKDFYKYCSTKCKWKDNDNIQQIKKNTCLEKYGAVNILASEYGKNKSKQTQLEKYGVDNYTKTDEYKEKVKGKKIHPDTIERVRSSHLRRFYDTLNDKFNGIKPLFSFEEYDGVAGYKKYKWQCLNCSNIFMDSVSFESPPTCRKCKPLGTKHEIMIKKFLDSLNIEYTYNDRSVLPSGKELDIYIPSKSIAIEICGLFWHSTLRKPNKDYHKDKMIECSKNGIELITIFDDEIYEKKRIVLNRLKAKLGLVKRSIFARKCEIREVTSQVSKRFLLKYHIQGSINGSYRYGLFYKNRLVSLMTFNKGRLSTGNKSTDGVYELGRYVTIANFNIVGGASRLLNHFIKFVKPNRVFSYCDLRWNNGNVYEKSGMRLVKVTNPNYYYSYDCKSRLHRFRFHKSKLKNMSSYDDKLTEEEIMHREGYFRIYDCGSKLYEMICS